VRQTSRTVALEAIRRVLDEDAYSTIVVPAALRRSRLDGRDRAYATDLAFGTIRHLRSIDWALDRVATRPVSRMSPGARNVLRLGGYQVLFTDTPQHAAVGETVGLARDRERGFVNAVLRKLASAPTPWPEGADASDIAVRTGLTPWTIEELGRLLPADEVEPAARAFATQAPLSLRTNTDMVSVEGFTDALKEAGRDPQPSLLDASCVLVDGGDPSSFPGFSDGWFAIQDQASAYVVKALDPQPGDRVLDACAAPGGKTIYAAQLVGDDGLVVGADIHPGRVPLIRKAATRLGARALVMAQDAEHPALKGSFDRIMIDAPCSGLGSARRRPELLWRNRKDELSKLARTQVAITAALTDLLKPGGRLVYSVCTFPRAETDAAADAIIRHRADLEPVEIAGPDGRTARVRLWPHRHGSDGMFVAAFTRKA
jgi:16S rRNA (cytosine967-C5)-methyltransferase